VAKTPSKPQEIAKKCFQQPEATSRYVTKTVANFSPLKYPVN